MREDNYRNALMWVFDRLSVDDGLTPQQQRKTLVEIGNVLQQRPSVASDYMPDEWTDSAKLTRRAV